MEVKNFKAKRQFAFTDKEVKARCEEDNGKIEYTDSLCMGLNMITGKSGNGSYVLSTSYKGKCLKKTIGNVWRMSVEEARDIVRNIQANKDEFMANDLKYASLKHYRIVFKDISNYKRFKDTYDKSKISIIKDDNIAGAVDVTVDDKNINTFIEYFSSFELKEFNNIKETLEDFFMKFYKEEKDFGGALNAGK